jgi:hypothetical protein
MRKILHWRKNPEGERLGSVPAALDNGGDSRSTVVGKARTIPTGVS